MFSCVCKVNIATISNFLGGMLCSATFVFLGYLRTKSNPNMRLCHHAFKCPTVPSRHPNHYGHLKSIKNVSNVDKRLVHSGEERPRFDKDDHKPTKMQEEKALEHPDKKRSRLNDETTVNYRKSTTRALVT